MPDGRQPEPGGWEPDSLRCSTTSRAEVERLRAAGVSFRNEIISGPGGQQILVDDPSVAPTSW